jgi:hypothetical protein
MDELEKRNRQVRILGKSFNRIASERNRAIDILFKVLAEVQAPDDTSDIEEYKRMQDFIIDIICEFLQEDN